MPTLRCLVVAVGALALLGSLAFASTASAQANADAACPYSECAVRLKAGFFGRSLVRGTDEDKVMGLGFWIGSLDSAFEGNPEAIAIGERYRRRHNVGSVVALAGLAAVVTGYARERGNLSDATDTNTGLVFSGSLLAFLGAIVAGSGEDALHRAIWEYNRTVGGGGVTHP